MESLTANPNLSDDESSAIPRNRLFVLVDGTFVVHWSEGRVQELQSGRYRTYKKQSFGAPITDYELHQLQKAGLVKKFDKEQVVLCPLPERQDSGGWLTTWEINRTRSYYLNTTLPATFLDDVNTTLDGLGLAGAFEARVRDNFVVLWGNKGISFQEFDDAEKARVLLANKAPDTFANTVVAFVETTRRH